MRRALAVFGLLIVGCSTATSGPKLPRILTGKLTPCRVPDVDEEVLCGRYEVYENRAAGTGRKIGLNIVVLPPGNRVATTPFRTSHRNSARF